MFAILCTLVVLSIVGLILVINASLSAPHGVEDRDGFHATSSVEQEGQEPSLTVFSNPASLAFFSR